MNVFKGTVLMTSVFQKDPESFAFKLFIISQ